MNNPFVRRHWTLTHSNKGWAISIGTENIFWDILDSITSFIVHKIFRFVPMPPFPVLCADLFSCERDRLHWHFSRSWYGKTMESFMCMYLDNFFAFKALDWRNDFLSLELNKLDVRRIYKADKDSRDFIKEINNLWED